MEKGNRLPVGLGVARGDSRRSEQHTIATPDAEQDLHGVLAIALQQLVAATGASRAAAWWSDADGLARVAAAAGSEPPVRSPSAAEYAAVAGLAAAADLAESAPQDPALAAILRDGYDAAAPVAPASGSAAAVLLLGGTRGANGRARPRTLAALGGAARRVEGPLLAALAGARLARLDADVRRLDRLAALGGLVAEVVHEVRNPLVSVKTFLQLLPERTHDAEFLQNFLDVAGDELQRIERMLDLVLDHASPRAPAPARSGDCEAANVVAAVTRLLAHRAAAAGVRLEADVPPGLCVPVAADALRQVLLNLALNALDATAEGGDVRIAARALGRVVQIDVEDRGPGIPRALRRRLFEPFFSTKPERPGGLGLAISLRIVDEADGTIAITDRPGGGTRFRLRLPLA